MSRTISIPSPEGGAFDAELAEPAGTTASPLLLLVPSVFGVTGGFKNTVDRYATRGYFAIAADPFWRTLPGPLELERRAEARGRMDHWTPQQGFDDMRATLDWAQTALPHWNGKFAVVGFCFGGQHAMIGLERLGADAAVAYHGSKMNEYLADADAIGKPFSFHFGELDHVVPLEQVAEIRTALAGKDGEIYVYPGVGHSFAREGAPEYSPEVAGLSEARAFAVLAPLKAPATA
jgi:carboxymethylenebutenolidase